MIIARSPLRISFAGGGTDIPAFYRNFGPGKVVSTSINKYVYVAISEKFGGGISLRYRIHENQERASELKHGIVREALLEYGIDSGVEIVISSDVPSRGSGLGASSALACALVAVLERMTYKNSVDKKIIAEKSSEVEIERVRSPIGKQDHYASAFGGLNQITFNKDESVLVTPFEDREFVDEVERQSMLFYLKIEHEYEADGTFFVQRVLKDQVADMNKNHKLYELQRDNAQAMWEHMAYGVPERFIDHVNENWRLKRSSHSGISNSEIDSIVQKAYKAGATAAKVCGAGGGGFLYLVVPLSMQNDVRRELYEYPELQFRFDKKGTEVIYDGTESQEAVV